MTKFSRVAYFVAADGQSDILLSDAEHLGYTELLADAVATAYSIGLIGDDDHQITEDQLRASLHVGDYSVRG